VAAGTHRGMGAGKGRQRVLAVTTADLRRAILAVP
jgi:hypothetical protein